MKNLIQIITEHFSPKKRCNYLIKESLGAILEYFGYLIKDGYEWDTDTIYAFLIYCDVYIDQIAQRKVVQKHAPKCFFIIHKRINRSSDGFIRANEFAHIKPSLIYTAEGNTGIPLSNIRKKSPDMQRIHLVNLSRDMTQILNAIRICHEKL